MFPMHRRACTRDVPTEIREMVRDSLEKRGPRRASEELGVSRPVLLAVCADIGISPGSLALLREAFQRRQLINSTEAQQ